MPVSKGFYHTHAQLASVSYKHTKRRVVCATYIRIYTQTLIGIFFVHGKGNMHACLTRG